MYVHIPDANGWGVMLTIFNTYFVVL